MRTEKTEGGHHEYDITGSERLEGMERLREACEGKGVGIVRCDDIRSKTK